MKATIVVLAVCLSLSGIAFAQEKSNAAYENAENLLKQGEVFKAYDKFLKAANLEPQNTTYKQRLNEVGKLASAQAQSNGREKMNIAPEEAELWFRRAVAYDMSNSTAVAGVFLVEQNIAWAQTKAGEARAALDRGDSSSARSQYQAIKSYRGAVPAIDDLEKSLAAAEATRGTANVSANEAPQKPTVQDRPMPVLLPTSQTLAPTTPKVSSVFGLASDTPIKLKLTQTLSSATAYVDDRVEFEVVEDVKVNDVIVCPHGGFAMATVTQADAKRSMGRAGKLNINIDYLKLVNGEKVPLRAVKGGSGGSHAAAMTGAIVATSIAFFPAAPPFLVMHGKDITIPKGTEITAYVAADTPLDQVKFSPPGPGPQVAAQSTPVQPTLLQPTPTTNLGGTSVIINSTPDGADIIIDGKYMGSTQSSLRLTPGDHTISIEKGGYKLWQRTIMIGVIGSVRIEGTLEKTP